MKKAFLFETVLLFVFCFTSNAFSLVSETQKGVAVYDFMPGFENYEVDTDESTLILGGYFDHSKAIFRFYLPPQFGIYDIDYLKVTVHGTGTIDQIKFGGPTAVFWTNVTDTATFEFPNAGHPSITINDLLESNNDSLSGRRLRMQIDATGFGTYYNLQSITIEYDYCGAFDQQVSSFMETYTAYLNIKSSSETIYARWYSGAYTSELMFWLGWTRALGTMVMSAFNEVVGGLVSWGVGNIPWFSVVDMADIAEDITWFRNSNGDYCKDDIDNKCKLAYQDCENLALWWKHNFMYNDPDYEDFVAKISELETRLNSLEATLNQAVSTGLFPLYDIYIKRWTYGDGTPASSHEGDLMAEVMMRSFAPLIAYDFSETQAPTARSDSFIYKLKQTLLEQKDEFTQITISASPSGKSLKFKVDGAECTENQTFHWASGSSHTIEATSPQTGNDSKEYRFQCWSDNGWPTHVIEPTTDTQITAYYAADQEAKRTASADTYIAASSPDTPHNVDRLFAITGDYPLTDISVVKFNLSSIPIGSVINFVEFEVILHFDDNGSGKSVELGYNTGSDWTEAGLTWNNAALINNTIGSINRGLIASWLWDSGNYPVLGQIVDDWVNDSGNYPNKGFILQGENTGDSGAGRMFYSREASNDILKPKLTVHYTPPPPTPGSLTVVIYPTEIQSIARWRLTGGPDTGWKQSGDTINGIIPDDYTLIFNSVPEWNTPANQNVQINDGQTTNTTGNYVQTGSLTVTINPSEVLSEARWRLTGGPDTTWKSSGDTINNIITGQYSLEFKDVSGWEKPSSKTITINQGSNSESGTYIRLPVITARTPSSGPPGTYMKIEGQYFGGSGSVIFAGGATGQILSWSDTEILCKVPSGASSGNVVVQTSVSSNGVYYTVTDPTTIYVDHIYTPDIENGTTTYPFSTIQRGIDAATTSDEVIVADGTYTGQGNRDIELYKAITVRSSNPTDPNIVAATIIDCQGSTSEPHRGFNMQSGFSGPILNGLTIENGYADYGGGISCRIQNDKSIIINCIIRNNTADYGGGMYNSDMHYSYSSPTVTNCTFSGNVSNNQGGGMYISEGSGRPIMTNCVFNGNVANSDGGGIYGGAIVITDCTISSNTSYSFGGGICGYGRSGGYGLITSCNISKNTSVLGAGGISCGYLDINDCTINENESNGNGGGISSTYGTINRCVISNNTSKGHGGGICTGGPLSTITITDCNFIGNNAVYSGGGIAVTFLTSATVSHCTFSENSAADGGGMSTQTNGSTVTNCVFTANVADTYGGGMYNLWGSRPTVMNCIFTGNISLQYGGAICNNNWCNSIITNCTLSANSANISGGGMFSISDSNSIVENCILWGNASPSGAQICDMNGSSASVTFSNVQGGEAGVYQDPNCVLFWGQGNIDTDPLFVDSGYWDPNSTPMDPNDDFWVNGDYHLLSHSPCIDAGDPNYVVDPNEHDIDGDIRIIGGRIDIGADEYAFGELSDFNNDGIVNFKDFAILANYWMDYVCVEPDWCEGCDFDHSGLVDLNDLRKFAENWLAGVE
jgi:predicted outer membrane repeat protein